MKNNYVLIDYENVLLFHDGGDPLFDYGLAGSGVAGGTTVDGGRMGRTFSRISWSMRFKASSWLDSSSIFLSRSESCFWSA